MARYLLNSQGFPVGSVSEITTGPAKGFRFLPMIQRGPSRKSWPTAESAIPADLRRQGCVIVEVSSIDEAVRLGGVWRRSGLAAMRAEIAKATA